MKNTLLNFNWLIAFCSNDIKENYLDYVLRIEKFMIANIA